MPGTLKVLILEDNPGDAGLTLRALKTSELRYEYRMVDNKKDYTAALKEFKPDVILSDHSLPSFTSEEALPLAKEFAQGSVFILVTGTVSEEFAVKIIKAGADDYILKSSLMRLPSAIINAYMKKKAEVEREANLRKLSEVNQELKTFIYRASHDIRGPLSSMKGLINVAKIEQEASQMAKLIGLMDVSAEKLDKIVVDLIETLGIRDLEIVKREVDFKELLDGIMEPYQDLVSSGVLKISMDIGDAGTFMSDKNILGIVIKRVIDNAVKFHNYSTPGAFVKIKVAADAGHASIVISDNGIGIKEELIAKVFEMFYRANGDSEGSGLGLYVAKIGTEKLGGTVSLRSTEQVGTTVSIEIPGE